MVIGAILRPAAVYLARTIYQALRVQDKIIDKTYRKAGLYNRGVVKGIQHGLAGGQIIGGTLQLGLNAEDSPGNGGTILPQKPKSGKPYQTRNRRTRRSSYRNTVEYCINRHKRRSRSYRR